MRRFSSYRLNLTMRRTALATLVAGSTVIAALLWSEVIAARGLDALGCASVVLFTMNFAWLSLSFWSAVFGFTVRLIRGDPISLASAHDRPLTTRTAIIMPICNEDAARVAAGIEASILGLEETGEAHHFDVFVLSDSQNTDGELRERQMIARFREQHAGSLGIYYRRRQQNIGRKAGNIEDFIRRWGADYAHMIVFDADSVMSGQTLVALARLMEMHPDCGIIQTLPTPTGGQTLFARMLQFANRLYAPVMASGLACWTGGDSLYYGHNAILRIEVFARYCGLPILPGKAPLGGEILSHDFIEGALTVGGGYKVWLVPELTGSYEGMPANIIDYAKRDRRWCHGNLQHARLLGLPLVKPMGRLLLSMGVLSYLTSPLWLLLLVSSTADVIQHTAAGIVYFKPGFNLFPDWPVAADFQIDLLLGMTLTALLLPKIMGLSLALLRRVHRDVFGGVLRLCASVLMEIVFSTLLAPIMMLLQSTFVAEVLFARRSVAWMTQSRDDRGLEWREAFQRHAGHTALGVLWAGALFALAPHFFWWLAPIWLGLVLSVPLSVWSSRRNVGRALMRAGLLLTPEETRPPRELRRMRRALHRRIDPLAVGTPATDGAMIPPESGLAMPRIAWPGRRLAGAGEAVTAAIRDAS